MQWKGDGGYTPGARTTVAATVAVTFDTALSPNASEPQADAGEAPHPTAFVPAGLTYTVARAAGHTGSEYGKG